MQTNTNGYIPNVLETAVERAKVEWDGAIRDKGYRTQKHERRISKECRSIEGSNQKYVTKMMARLQEQTELNRELQAVCNKMDKKLTHSAVLNAVDKMTLDPAERLMLLAPLE